jgi:hypothetical protein
VWPVVIVGNKELSLLELLDCIDSNETSLSLSSWSDGTTMMTCFFYELIVYQKEYN